MGDNKGIIVKGGKFKAANVAVGKKSSIHITENLSSAEMPDDNVPIIKKILFLASSPLNLGKLQLEKEFAQIHNQLQKGKIVYEIVSEWAITPAKMQQAILEHQPNFIHFSGHGNNDDYDSGIFLNNYLGESQLVPSEALTEMFEIFKEKITIEIVVLNSCYSATQAIEIQKHVPFVVGMNTAIADVAAIAFSTGFYNALSEDSDVDYAFRLAKNQIHLENLKSQDIPVLLVNKKASH